MTTQTVETRRRELTFESLDDVLLEAERLAATERVELLGTWTLGQIFDHIARAMDKAIDGTSGKLPLLTRIFARLFRGKMLRDMERSGLPAGFRLPKSLEDDFLPDADVSTEEGLEHLRRAVERMRTEDGRAPHVAFGELTHEQHDLLHRRHAAMHMSHVVPLD